MFSFLYELYFNKKLRNVSFFLGKYRDLLQDVGVGKDFLNTILSHQTNEKTGNFHFNNNLKLGTIKMSPPVQW